MTFSMTIQKAVLERWPINLWRDSIIVVAVSGGADSTALLTALNEIRPDKTRMIVAHYNHALRGAESDADQAFVETFAASHGIPCVVQRADRMEVSNRSENSLRKLRHQFLKDVAKARGARWIAMAHQADDQVETFLHHLLRGSGPSGLSGIQTFRSVSFGTDIVRPFLDVSRSQIQSYLAESNQPFRTDLSNESPDYARNRIRNELLPFLRAFTNSKSLDSRLLSACELICEEHLVFKELADRWLAKVGYALEERLDTSLNEDASKRFFSVPIPMCRNEPWPIVREALVMIWHRMDWPLREMNHMHWRRLQRLVEVASQTTHAKRLDLPGQIAATCRQGTLRIERFLQTS